MEDQRDRELAAILAGLRLLQCEIDLPDAIFDILTNMRSFIPLHKEEIEDLCQRLNTEWDQLHSDLDTCQQRVTESAREWR